MQSSIQKRKAVPSRQLFALFGVLLALCAPILSLPLRPLLESTFGYPLDRFVSLLLFWAVVVVVLFYAIKVEGYSLARFGIKRSWDLPLRQKLIELILAVLSALLFSVVLIAFSTQLRQSLGMEPPKLLNIETLPPFWILLFAWFTGSIAEEILFRSYPIERLTDVWGKRWLAGLVTSLVFTLLHLVGWDCLHVLTVVLPGSILLTILYLWRRSLLFVIVVHGVVNAPILFLPLLAPYL